MKTHKKVSTEDRFIDVAEKTLNVLYPQFLRNKLKERNDFYLAGFKFYCVKDEDDIQHTFDDVVRENKNEQTGWQKYIPEGHAAIADDGGQGCLVLNIEKDGKIYYWNNYFGKLTVYANNEEELASVL